MDRMAAVEICLEFTNPKLELTLLLLDKKLSYLLCRWCNPKYSWEVNRAKELAVHGALKFI
jgi:hypothetical protein